MSALTLHLISSKNASEIIAFEQENRAFFAQFVPDRGDDYFSFSVMERFLAEIEAEQARGVSYLYLVRLGSTGELVGRVNLVDIQETSASLGYRIGERFGGKGYATESVRLALQEAAARGITTIRAMTTVSNVGSQMVLLRNGFQFTERRPLHLDVNGTLHDAVCFEKR